MRGSLFKACFFALCCVSIVASLFVGPIGGSEEIPESLMPSDLAAFLDLKAGKAVVGRLVFNGSRFNHLTNTLVEPEAYVPTRLQAVLAQQGAYAQYLKEGKLLLENGEIKNRITIQILGCAATLDAEKKLQLTPEVTQEVVNYYSGIVVTSQLPQIRKTFGKEGLEKSGAGALDLRLLEGQVFKLGQPMEIQAILRNVSNQPLTLVQPALDWTLSIWWGRDSNQLALLDMKSLVNRIPPAVSVIPPGKEATFVKVLSPSIYAIPSEPGEYYFQILYSRTLEDYFGQKVWTGEARSASVKVRVVA